VEEVKSEINLKVDIRIPEDYLPQVNLRLNLYKRISSIEKLEELRAIEEEIRDRFGPLPSSLQNLLCYGVVKFLAQRLKIKALDRIDNKILFKFFPTTSVQLERMIQLMKRYSGTITPQGVMAIRLPSSEENEMLDETIIILKELYGYNIMS